MHPRNEGRSALDADADPDRVLVRVVFGRSRQDLVGGPAVAIRLLQFPADALADARRSHHHPVEQLREPARPRGRRRLRQPRCPPRRRFRRRGPHVARLPRGLPRSARKRNTARYGPRVGLSDAAGEEQMGHSALLRKNQNVPLDSLRCWKTWPSPTMSAPTSASWATTITARPTRPPTRPPTWKSSATSWTAWLPPLPLSPGSFS